MVRNSNIARQLTDVSDTDPRVSSGAEVIDLATRNVIPAVAHRKSGPDLGLLAGVAIVGLLGAVTWWSLDNTRTTQVETNSPTAVEIPSEKPDQLVLPEGLPIQALPPAQPQPLPAPPPQSVLAAAPEPSGSAVNAIAPRGAPALVFDIAAGPVPAPVPGAPAGSGPASGNGNDEFISRVGGIGGSAATATASIDPKTTVTQGTLIPAILETAIDTDVPGYARAIVSTDVRSFDGTRVLIPRSSRLIGQYKSGMQAGQKRAYVVWSRLIRPDGVTVNIGSPAVAFSGQTGLSGKVDTHFFERFGSAMLLSVVGGLSAISGPAGLILGGGGQSAAAAAVGQTGQIGPTIRVRQGEPIRVFTARDLDFSKVSTE